MKKKEIAADTQNKIEPSRNSRTEKCNIVIFFNTEWR